MIRSNLITAALCAIMIFAVTSFVAADVPHMINYQGILADSAGNPLDTTVSMTFTIYDDSTAGAVRWTETHPAVSVVDGGLNVRLGEVNPVSDMVFTGERCWLGVQIGSDAELTPRSELLSIPHSFRVSTVILIIEVV